jgi:hypothetical protein
MKPWAKILMIAFSFLAPASLPAAPPPFEIAIFPETWWSMGHPQTAETVEPALRKLRRSRPMFTIQTGDIESYLWQTQRITLTREVTARLNAMLKQSWELALGDHFFLVRLDGETLYGGLVVDPGSAKSAEYPVIHTEQVDGQGIFYLLPITLYPGSAGKFEETVGFSRWFVRSYRKDLDPFDPASDERPEVIRFRKVLRDERVRTLFEKLGKLVPSPLPPRTPVEIRTALLQTDERIDFTFANGNAGLASDLIASSYRRISPPESWMDKSDIVDAMRSGSWKLPFYATLAKEEPILTGNCGAILRALVALRGHLGGHNVDEIVIATRRYEFTGDRWILKDETLANCAEDDPEGSLLSAVARNWRTTPCWPPGGTPEPDPRLDGISLEGATPD